MPEGQSYNEKELLLQVAEGNRDAFHTLYDHYRNKIYYVANKMLQSNAAAEDVLQEIFIKIWVNRESLRHMDYFSTWLNSIVRNHLYNHFRKKANEEAYLLRLLPDPADPSQPFDETAFRELKQLLANALAALPSRQQEVFQLSREQGLTHAAIAAKLGISPETVKKHMMEALRFIRSYLSAHGAALTVWLLLS
ncbi:MAG: RNA polymerase sigma-70 factor [Chitinophagaceae bacterium]|nr:RNA polymerase sigma-70 factor [Chitinophagaceae bacterium]